MKRPIGMCRGPIVGWLTLFMAATYLVAHPIPAYAQPDPASDIAEVPPSDHLAFIDHILFLPYVGANLALGDTAKAFNLGYRLGGILGYRVSPILSLNGEIAFDHLSPIDEEGGFDLDASAADLAFSPTFHIALGRGEIVLGPKIGVFRYSTSLNSDWTGNPPKAATDYGLAYGLNLGLFGKAGELGVGVLLGYSGRHGVERCPTRYADTVECPHGNSEQKLLTVALALLF